MELLWVGAVLGGFGLAMVSSRRAVRHAEVLAGASRIPPFFIGITLFAIGTDLPEMANSIVASVSGHGDLNVGDSVGSAATQATLVLGLLPLLAVPFLVGRRRVTRTGIATVIALGVGALLVADGYLSRLNAALLIAMWVIGSIVIWRGLPPAAEPTIRVPARRPSTHAAIALAMLAGVALGASAAVWGLVNIGAEFDIPEYVLAFFVAAVGTSLPEFIVNVTALRRGARDLALGGLLGASFVDSTLSIGIGPLIAPTLVTASFAVRGALAAALALAIVTGVLVWRRRHDRISGVAFIALWLALYVVLLR